MSDRAHAALSLPFVAVFLIIATAFLAYRVIWADCIDLPDVRWAVFALHAAMAFAAAAMAFRWCRSGSIPWFLAVYGTSAAVFRSDPGQAFLAILATLTITVFAMANVYGPRPLWRSNRWAWFYSIGLTVAVGFGGLAGLAIAVLPCLATAAFNSDARGVRFVLRPLNWLAAALAGTARASLLEGPWTAWVGEGELTLPFADGLETATQLAWALSPWWPIALTAIMLGVRLGHYATPFWRLCGAWFAVGLGLGLVGLATVEMAAALVLPPLALISAHALRSVRSQCSAFWLRRGHAARPTLDMAFVRLPRRPARLRPVMATRQADDVLTAPARPAASR